MYKYVLKLASDTCRLGFFTHWHSFMMFGYHHWTTLHWPYMYTLVHTVEPVHIELLGYTIHSHQARSRAALRRRLGLERRGVSTPRLCRSHGWQVPSSNSSSRDSDPQALAQGLARPGPPASDPSLTVNKKSVRNMPDNN
jgi:hypothetical protein